MNPFNYFRAENPGQAVTELHDGKYLGGGTNLVDLMRETIERPSTVVDVTGLSREIERRDDGTLLIGAAATNTAVSESLLIRENFPMIPRSILEGASAQIRNMATVGGNILQRTRCAYFYDNQGSHCNKRNPGEGCDAIEGFNRMHVVLGGSSSCVATHPSDFAVSLSALDALVHVRGAEGERIIPLNALHRLPGDRPDLETTMNADELITKIEIPPLSFAKNSTYRKVRDRSSYAFALVSVAAALEIEDGHVKDVRLAFGGVAPKPWRAHHAEAALKGRPASFESFRAAAQTEFLDAKPLRDNEFKIELAVRTMTAVLQELSNGGHA